MKKSRNGVIDFMRFVFAVVLVVFHSHTLNIGKTYDAAIFPMHYGSLAVEFFLITSGFLLAKSMNKTPENDILSWRNTWQFIKGKIMGFYPAFVICWAIAFIAYNIVHLTDWHGLYERFARSVFELTLIRNAGFEIKRMLPQAWYLSAMILIMFLLYPLYAKNKKRFEYYIAPLIAVFVLGYLCYVYGSLLNPSKKLDFTFKGNLRVLAEICLGVVCYNFCEMLKKLKLTGFGRTVFTVLELLGYVLSILYMQFYTDYPNYFHFVLLLLLAISVTISFSEVGLLFPLFRHSFFNLLGKFSLYPYLLYSTVSMVLPRLFPEMDIYVMIVVYIAATLALSAVVMALHSGGRKLFRTIKENRKKAKEVVVNG